MSSGRDILSVRISAGSAGRARREAGERFRDIEFEWGENEAARQIREYFAGARRRFDLRPVLVGRPPFYRKALEACAEVPFGEVITYGRLAGRAGLPRAFRAVGQALKANPVPIVIPCHRIVGAHDVGGFSATGGLRTKWALLEIEGVRPGNLAR